MASRTQAQRKDRARRARREEQLKLEGLDHGKTTQAQTQEPPPANAAADQNRPVS